MTQILELDQANPYQAQTSLGVYSFLARRQWPKSYVGKIMLVAFLGTHIPLLALFIYSILMGNHDTSIKIRFLAVALSATLTGTAATLLMLHRLLAPINATFRGLRNYLENRTLPDLPTRFTDEAGLLMSDTMTVISKVDEALHQLKNYDRLTGLPNRTLFCDRVQEFLQNAGRQNQIVTVMVMDLDDFTAINHSFGADDGDALLRQVAQRLRAQLGDQDLLSRLSRDEFAIATLSSVDQETVTAFAQTLQECLQKSINLSGRRVNLTASIGIALAESAQDITASGLLNDAEAALRNAKTSAHDSICFHHNEMNVKMRQRLEILHDLRGALERNEFQVWYQPQYNTHQGRTTGMEALIRWQHGTRGMVSPLEFIPAAESSGLIVPIGKWVLETACTQARAWQLEGLGDLRVAVNLSAVQFQQSNLIETVRQVLNKTQLPPHLLELEITESLLMDAQNTQRVLEGLHELGVVLALDDFGTGFSSLSYLKRFPLDVLKIDRAFIRDVPDDKSAMAITQSIIALAQGLNLDLIAEGIETKQQVDYLHRNGCYHLQGFFYSRPLPGPEFETWVKQQATVSEASQPLI